MKNVVMLALALTVAGSATLVQAADTAATPDASTATKPTGAEAMQSQMDMQKNKPSKPVDKNAKVAPRPDASKMTPEERAAYRKDVVKDAKP